jgi:4-coumarate--CoA ligase
MISHGNHVANASQVIKLRELTPDWETLQETAKWLCMLPMYHAYGQSYFITIAARVGTPVYVMKRFDLVQMLECAQKYKITTFHLVPPIAVLLAKSPLTKNYDLSSIRSVGSGAAPLSTSIMKEVDALFPEETGMKMTVSIVVSSAVHSDTSRK